MVRTLVFAAILSAYSLPAYAFSLAFSQPDGVASNTDDIDVYVTLTATDAFSFNGADVEGSFGLDPNDLPLVDISFGDDGLIFIPYESYTGATTDVAISCGDGGSFTAGGEGCRVGSDYEFNFNLADNSFLGQDVFSMMPGESREYLFGTFSPIDGVASPGEYNFYSAFFGFRIYGLGTNDAGETVDLSSFITFARTCTSGDQSCDFTRTVVPAPAAAFLFFSALLSMFGISSARRSS